MFSLVKQECAMFCGNFFMGIFYARIPLHACTNNAQLVHTRYTPTVRKTRTLSHLEEGDHSSGGLFGVR